MKGRNDPLDAHTPSFSRLSGGRAPVALGAHKSNSFLGISPSPRARKSIRCQSAIVFSTAWKRCAATLSRTQDCFAESATSRFSQSANLP